MDKTQNLPEMELKNKLINKFIELCESKDPVIRHNINTAVKYQFNVYVWEIPQRGLGIIRIDNSGVVPFIMLFPEIGGKNEFNLNETIKLQLTIDEYLDLETTYRKPR
jgi:hypothetical protein